MKLADSLCALAFCAVPALAVFAVVHGLLGASLADYRPRSWDELDYWHEISTFATVGFNGGHYGLEGDVAPAAILGSGTFGPHGFWPILAYGLPARAFGWSTASPPFFNIAIMTAGLLFMVLCLRPAWTFSLKAGALLVTCCYIDLNTPVMLLESLILGLNFAMAGLFGRLMMAPLRKGWPAAAWTLGALIVAATLVRYYYGLLFFGLLLYTEDPRNWRQWFTWGMKGLLLMAGAVLASWFTMAPFPYDAFPGSVFGPNLYAAVLHGDLGLLWRHLRFNWTTTFYPEVITPYHVYFLAIVVCAVAFPLLCLRQAATSPLPDVRRRASLAACFHCINLAGGLGVLFFYYYTMINDYGPRFMTPSLFLSTFVLLRLTPGRWWIPLLALNIVLAPAFLRDCRSVLQGQFGDVPADIDRLEDESLLRQRLHYDVTARNPWCNTLQTAGFFNFDRQLGVPPGLGINETRQVPGMRPPRAAHVLAKGPQALDVLGANPSLSPVVSGPDWTLYRNEAADCSGEGQGD